MGGSGQYHFVLVHGMGHGAWCRFKVSALLQAQGHTVTALDLASSGIHKASADSISSIADYLAPLTHFLAHSVPAHTQVILVGHSLGGSSISYAMELFPHKICKAVFVSAFMPTSGSFFLPFEMANNADAKRAYDCLLQMASASTINETAHIPGRTSSWTPMDGTQYALVNKYVDKDMVKFVWPGIIDDKIKKGRLKTTTCMIIKITANAERIYVDVTG